MTVKPFRKINTADMNLNRVQDAVAESLFVISKGLLVDSVLVADVALASGVAQEVAHGLGRPALGWIVVKRNANATVWEPSTSVASDKFVRLQSDANVTINILFF